MYTMDFLSEINNLILSYLILLYLYIFTMCSLKYMYVKKNMVHDNQISKTI